MRFHPLSSFVTLKRYSLAEFALCGALEIVQSIGRLIRRDDRTRMTIAGDTRCHIEDETCRKLNSISIGEVRIL